MYLLGFVLASFIGIALGLIGGGGSILTVPLLVYVFHVSPVMATAYSLFVVGSSSLVGGAKKILDKEISLKTTLLFGAPSVLSIYVTRMFIIPALPTQLFSFGNFAFSKDLFIMILFAIFMLVAGIIMIRGSRVIEEERTEVNPKEINYPMVIGIGLLLGIFTGLVGAGGGFMIIPVLVILLRLPMKEAVGTSLAIIAINSLIGFTGDMQNYGEQIDWVFLLLLSSVSILGIFVGMYLSKFIQSKSLKKGFGWLVLLMSIFIIYKELN